jgi:hypothetical protein
MRQVDILYKRITTVTGEEKVEREREGEVTIIT